MILLQFPFFRFLFFAADQHVDEDELLFFIYISNPENFICIETRLADITWYLLVFIHPQRGNKHVAADSLERKETDKELFINNFYSF